MDTEFRQMMTFVNHPSFKDIFLSIFNKQKQAKSCFIITKTKNCYLFLAKSNNLYEICTYK